MVDYNMKLNQYVDLPSQTSSSFSNALFPNNLFDEVIFHNSPNELYKKAMDLSRVLPEGEKSKIVGIAKVYQENTSYINAVSYTHLDVYKRQEYNRKEWSLESFDRSFRLPEDANMEEISAEMKNGILTVFLHKTEKKVSKIEVK